ncbi:hypothetical protein PF005_g7586 [Phytophthora fragariae]|uniref:Uncharacterized protein n=1 Tax=Phytophthora fragariae TaxID=53985 RepID=A0A6A3YL90_9STRA|nr:hypothetical protein PF009_g8325 [Phytophthora fragariae]KAE9007999.1 hypothetical protein PF011_g10881 [Phytophthora fragariae]KAE9109633.1 hypothetical protein PF010_g11462 [Phytophthora fragariae]KAE9121456.1 hypothetical protein PF007_g7806 [Phytophthora fragariae]KAE9148547.1 hypothetical protein PF006_g6876 [Phytophthora fragariae]
MDDECVVVVIDGANVSCQKDGKARISKLAAAIQYFRSLGVASGRYPVNCVAFAPNFWLNVKPTPGARENGAMETDDWTLLNELVQKDHVILTPSQAHDDFYVIDYAVKYDGFIVTNDMFRDHVSNKRSFQGKRLTSTWVRSHCIDFTFVGREFMPNPRAMERVFTSQPSLTNSLPAATPVLMSSSSSSLSSSSLLKPPSDDENDVGSASDDVDEDDMVVDKAGTKRNKNIDLSEVTYYKVPRELLPMLHGEGGETMEKFQEYTGTYIVLPSHAALGAPSTPVSNVLTLSIYGPEAGRQQAVGHLDAFLLEMQQQAQYAFQQQQQQQQQYVAAQVRQTAVYPQQQQYHAGGNGSNGDIPTQDDHMMEIDPY